MRRFLTSAGAIALLAATFMIARADVNYTQGTGTVIFDFLCFSTKHCTSHVPINSAGTEIMTSANPGQVGAPAAAMADGWDATQGAKADAAASTDTGTFSLIALIKRALQTLTTIATNTGAAIPAGTANIGNVGQISQYPTGATAITASATGTTGATTATLAGTGGKTTFICGYSIRANATAATTVTNTITGTITATLSSIMWVAPAASGIGVDEMVFSPCIPASATNTGIAIVSGAPGTGGTVSSKGWGYQL